MGHRKLIDLPKVIKLEVPQAGFESKTHTINHYTLLPLDVIQTNWKQRVWNQVNDLRESYNDPGMKWEKHRLEWCQKGLVCRVTDKDTKNQKPTTNGSYPLPLLFSLCYGDTLHHSKHHIDTHVSFLFRHNGKVSFFIITKIMLRVQQHQIVF